MTPNVGFTVRSSSSMTHFMFQLQFSTRQRRNTGFFLLIRYFSVSCGTCLSDSSSQRSNAGKRWSRLHLTKEKWSEQFLTPLYIQTQKGTTMHHTSFYVVCEATFHLQRKGHHTSFSGISNPFPSEPGSVVTDVVSYQSWIPRGARMWATRTDVWSLPRYLSTESSRHNYFSIWPKDFPSHRHCSCCCSRKWSHQHHRHETFIDKKKGWRSVRATVRWLFDVERLKQ